MPRALDPFDPQSVPRQATAVAILAIALVVTACGGATAPPSVTQVASSQMSVSPATPRVTEPATPTTSVLPPSASPTASNPPEPAAGGVSLLDFGCRDNTPRCQDMAAGTYETSGTWAFLRGLTVTLPASWSSYEQDAGEFELHQASDVDAANQILFWRDLVASDDGAPRPEVGTTTEALAEYLLTDRRLTVTEGPTRTFSVRGPERLDVAGTVQARSFSIILSDTAETDPDGYFFDCPAEACVGFLTDPDHWDGGSVALTRNDSGCSPACSQALRLYVGSMGRELHPHTFVVAVSTYGTDPLESLADWEAEVEPIIHSILVPYIVVDN
jgi:hypothetical protein